MRALLLASLAALALAAVAAGAVPPAPTPAASFPGMNSQQSNVNPADVQIAAGPTAVVQAVNSSIAIYSKTGQQLQQQTLGQFFSQLDVGIDRSHDSTTDPRVLFDPQAGRFFASMFDISRREIVLAMSITTDPLGPWAKFPVASGGCTDQPRLGTSDTLVILTDDLFSSCTGFGRFVGGEITVLSKQDMLAGNPNPQRAHYGPDLQFAAVTPAQALQASPVAYLVAVSQSAATLQLITVTSAAQGSLPVKEIPLQAQLTDPEEAPQRASLNPVDAGDNRIQNAVFDAGRVWATATIGCGAGRNCARVIELDPAAVKLVRESTVALPNGRSLLYPAIAPDSRGNLVMAFSYTSPQDFPGFGYTYVRPDGQSGQPFDVVAGTAPQGSGRFGDYSGAARDPSDPSRVWLSGEVGQTSTGSALEWGTGIAAATVPAQPPAVASSTAAAGKVASTVYAEGLATRVRLEYGPTRGYGATTTSVPVPAGARGQVVTLAPKGPAGTTVHARLVATSSAGTSTGPDVTLRLAPGRPTVTYPAAAATRSGTVVTLRALVLNGGAQTSVYFEYGPTRAYGSRTRGVGPVSGPVSVRIRVAPGRVYHFRVVATNAKGTTIASDRTVRT